MKRQDLVVIGVLVVVAGLTILTILATILLTPSCPQGHEKGYIESVATYQDAQGFYLLYVVQEPSFCYSGLATIDLGSGRTVTVHFYHGITKYQGVTTTELKDGVVEIRDGTSGELIAIFSPYRYPDYVSSVIHLEKTLDTPKK